jgi:PAS domain-containing protein
MIGQPILKLIPADRLDEEPAILSRLKVGERVDHFETKRLTKDKKIIDVSLTISPLKDSNGRIIGVSKIARDITLQKNAERIISENEERLQVVIAASDLGTWEINLKTGEVDYSERYLEIVDYTAGANYPGRHPENISILMIQRHGKKSIYIGIRKRTPELRGADRMER